MKKTELNRFLPYEADYSLLSKCRIWETRGLWLIGIFSVVLPVVGSFLASTLVIERLNLKKTKYLPTATYGHFTDPSYPWEVITEL